MNNSINDRLELLIRELGLNDNSFSRSIGLGASTSINNITGGRKSKPSYQLLEKILTKYKTIDANWLMKGIGTMFVNNDINRYKIETFEQKVEENSLNYETCRFCKHKQEIIDLQEKRISSLEKLIISKEETINILKNLMKS